MAKVALITGIAGQDGQHLAEYLLGLKKKDGSYERVIGMVHSQRSEAVDKLSQEFPGLEFVKGDLSDQGSLHNVIRSVKPDEVYNLGAYSHVGDSFNQVEKYHNVTGGGPFRLLVSMKEFVPESKFYQASSSEMFGKVQTTPQDEQTPFWPRSPYGIAKLCGHWSTVNFRESYDMFACSGILFNHEGPRRGKEFLTRKATLAAARIKLGLQNEVYFGNIHSKRDWGYAGDYVRAMHAMLQQPEPDDYVVATGETHSVQDFIERAFDAVDLPITWDFEPPTKETENLDKELRRIGVTKDGRVVVRISKDYFRPAEVDLLIGDASKAKRKLGWKPSVSFDQLVQMMAEHDLEEESKKVK